jgi:glycosyltransferase involved in cell wall biosynthesis
MKPLLIANFDRVVGGGEVGLRQLAEDLVGRSHQPVIAVPGAVPLFGVGDERSIPYPLPAGALAVRELARECDLVHVFSVRSALMAVLAHASRPLILHALVPDRDPYDPVIATIADAILCNSRATASRFGAAVTRVVYNGVRRPRPSSARLAVRAGRRTVGIVGSVSPRKGQLDVLPALDRVLMERDDVDVAFAGRIAGPVGLALEERADASNGRIRLLGFVPDIADHLGEFALVLVPSRSEGFSRVAVESLRAGVPVLATRVEGLIEALQDLRDPWLPSERDRWADRILRELDAPTHSRVELLDAANRFDPARFTDEILEIYRQVARC